MRKVGSFSGGTKPAAVEKPKSKTADLTSKPTETPAKPSEPHKPLTDETRAVRKQEKQMSGVMKQAAFQGAVKGQKFKAGSQSSVVGSQAKYGPTADLSKQQQKELVDHYGSGGKGKNPNERLTQYDKKHSTYVKAAEESGRQLTHQETAAKASGKNAPKSSIDHVIASGTGQNVMNEESLRFNQGKKMTQESYKTAISKPDAASPEAISSAQQQTRSGIAKQAAATGRMQGYSRAILKERKGETGPDGKPLDITQKRGDVLKGTLKAFQGKTKEERFGAYKGVLKETFDSPGNLRVGDSSANTKISTGFDAPLDADGKPTEQAKRLLHAHETFAPDRLLTEDRMFTKDKEGNILSSSSEKKPKGSS